MLVTYLVLYHDIQEVSGMLARINIRKQHMFPIHVTCCNMHAITCIPI